MCSPHSSLSLTSLLFSRAYSTSTSFFPKAKFFFNIHIEINQNQHENLTTKSIMTDPYKAHEARIASSLTEIEVSDLNPGNQECSICQLSLLPSSKAGETSCTGPPTRLICGHIFGKACVVEWLVENPTCPFCRFDLEPYVWRHERTATLNDLEGIIQLYDEDDKEGRGARRLRSFILRVTTEEEMPCEPICMTVRNLRSDPRLMTNEYLRKILSWWNMKAQTEDFTEGMLCGFPWLVAALLEDIGIHHDQSPRHIAASGGRGREFSLRSLLWRWTRP